jgi:hypothetical protein
MTGEAESLNEERGTDRLYWTHERVKGLVTRLRSKYSPDSESPEEVCALLSLSTELWAALELINELCLDDQDIRAVAARVEKKISTGKAIWERAEEYLIRHGYDERAAS